MIDQEPDFDEVEDLTFVFNMQELMAELHRKGVWIFEGIECVHLARKGVNIRCYTDIECEEYTIAAVTDPEINVLFEMTQTEFEPLRDFIISKLGLSNELQF